MITKRIHSQDAYYKISPKNSGETSLNLSNEILQLIAPSVSKGDETTVSFTLYRADYLKALGVIFNYSPLYISSSKSATEVKSDPNVFLNDFESICSFFGPNETNVYTVNLIYRQDGRIYLNSLEDKSSKFNLRHFLLEETSSLEFDKNENGITIRLKMDSIKDDELSHDIKSELIVSEKKLTSFVLSVIRYFDGKDKLNAIVPYASASSPIKVSKAGSFSLTGMFLESTIEEARQRNTVKIKRWFEDSFTLGNRTVFLSTQWNSQGDYQLTLEDFLKMIQTCYGDNYIFKNGPDGEYQLYHITPNREDIEQPLQQIFYGAPGTGKSHSIKTEVDEKGKQNFRITFHPDSDYSTFVGAYKPTMKENIISKNGVETKEEQIVYRFVPQAFTKAYTAAWNTEDDVYLIIEEINRGNCAQIFGDLFQLLDRKNGVSQYPIDADTDLADYIAKELANSPRTDFPEKVKEGKKLVLPSNLYIWATMNTSDQSLFPIDSAFKRRWDWKYLKIKDHPDQHYRIKLNDEVGYDWYDFIEKINQIIASMTSSADKQLGYFFCKADGDGIIKADTFVAKVIFYLWNDVFKDYGFEDTSLFTFTEVVDGKEETRELTFPDFYDKEGEKVDETRLKGFIDSVMNWKKKNEESN